MKSKTWVRLEIGGLLLVDVRNSEREAVFVNVPQFCCRSRIRRIITPITTTEYPTQVMAVSIHFFFLFIKFSVEAVRGGTAEVEIAYEVPVPRQNPKCV